MKSNAEKLATLLTAALANSPELSKQLGEVMGTEEPAKAKTPTRQERRSRIKAMFNQLHNREIKKHL